MADELNPPAGDNDPNPAPPAAGDNPPPVTTERPDWLPETLWNAEANAPVDLSTARLPDADRPDSADAYTLPEIDKVDLEQIKDSPFLQTMRTAAFTAGLGQEGFAKILTDWAEGEAKAGDDYANEQITAIGANFETRSATLATWLDGSLPADEAEALRALSTNAAAFKALERLMNKGAVTPPVPPPPPPVADDDATIRELMKSKAYSGKPHERDAAVIKRVEEYFAAQAKVAKP